MTTLSSTERGEVNNPPAFPTEWSPGLLPGEAMQTGHYTAQYPGMTLRDWFAGQTLPVAFEITSRHAPATELYQLAAAMAYKAADAMLAARGGAE